MATRPIFMPNEDGKTEVSIKIIEFDWIPGLSKVQKIKCFKNLHHSANLNGINDILEISSKSDDPLGNDLSAFNLSYIFKGEYFPVESIFQSAKVFEKGGPYEDIKFLKPLEAKRDERLKSSGDLCGFKFDGIYWEQNPKTAFYDWIYISALSKKPELIKKLDEYSAFTDIEFNPKLQINCQARSVAFLKTLLNRGTLQESLKNKSSFLKNYNSSEEENTQLELF